MALGDNIRRIRTNLGMTQGDLATKSGVKLGQISKIERNEADTRSSTLYKIINALDCSADSIFMDQEKTGIKGILKEAFECAAQLPDEDKEKIIWMIDRCALANGLDTMLDNHRVLIKLGKNNEKGGRLLEKEKG